MKSASCCFLFFAFAAVGVCDAAILNFTRTANPLFHGRSESLGVGTLHSFPIRFTTLLDTVADVGQITNAEFGMRALGGVSKHTFVTNPTDFPNPPTETKFTETLTFDPIVSTPVQFVSSNPAPIVYQNGYRFFPTVNLVFPASFTLSGSLKIEGPTQTVTTPFSMLFTRIGASGNVSRNGGAFISLGANFPETVYVSASIGSPSVAYQPSTTTLFNGMVDGFSFQRSFRTTHVYAELIVPEPTSACLWALGLASFWSTLPMRRVGTPTARGRVGRAIRIWL